MLLENGGFELNCNNVIMLGIQGMIKNRPTQAKAQEPSLHARGPTRLGAGLKLFLSRNWDLRLVALYSVALMAVTVPELKWGYDLGHDPGLLMSSVRIWAGQVPYRNFYPWYGPLYHYLLAFFVGIAGNTLYGLKAYIDVVNPLLCMLILVLILRFSGMSLSGRIFTMIAVPLFGLERIYYCGSLRSFLPVLAVYRFWLESIGRQDLVTFGKGPALHGPSDREGFMYRIVTGLAYLVGYCLGFLKAHVSPSLNIGSALEAMSNGLLKASARK